MLPPSLLIGIVVAAPKQQTPMLRRECNGSPRRSVVFSSVRASAFDGI